MIDTHRSGCWGVRPGLGPTYIQSNAILSNMAVHVQVNGCSGRTGVAVLSQICGRMQPGYVCLLNLLPDLLLLIVVLSPGLANHLLNSLQDSHLLLFFALVVLYTQHLPN